MNSAHITQKTFWAVIPIIIAIMLSIGGFLFAEIKEVRHDVFIRVENKLDRIEKKTIENGVKIEGLYYINKNK